MASKTLVNKYSVVRDGNTDTWDVVSLTSSGGSYVISDFPQSGDNLTVLGDISGDDVYLDTLTKSGLAVTGVYMGETSDGQSFVGENNDQYYLYTNAAYSQGEAFDTSADLFSVCFAAGTLIATPDGDVAVETIKSGDPVLTAGGASRAVKWMGHRSLDLRAEVHPETSWPVRIAAHAFAPAKPASDLVVSSAHALGVEVDGAQVLIPAGCLVNGTTVSEMPVERITWWHVELESHDLLLANGMPAESYLDMGNRNFFIEEGGTTDRLEATRTAHEDYCRPLHDRGVVLEKARAALMARAAELGHTVITTSEADAHVIADGERIAPVWLTTTRACFVLPAGKNVARLRSRAFVPAHVKAASIDRRRLGVCVVGLQVDGEPRPLASLPATGWHGTEDGGVRRWTDGDAVLPRGARVVILDLGGSAHYRQSPIPA
jgi:hypothetical protein